MTRAAYAVYLRSIRWRWFIRPLRLWIDGYRCRACFNPRGLHVHHASYVGAAQGWPLRELRNTVTLCQHCHEGVHSRQGIREFQD
jgi:5-methylcytosine-specific restriction endonuclease McrA